VNDAETRTSNPDRDGSRSVLPRVPVVESDGVDARLITLRPREAECEVVRAFREPPAAVNGEPRE